MEYQLMLQKVQQYIRDFFAVNAVFDLPYHNISHTENVVKAVEQIGNHYQLNDHDYFVVTTAAWFHDVGYYINDGKDHELTGAEMAMTYLHTAGLDEPTVSQIKQCIIATQLPQHPANLLEEIVCDGDLFHLGTDDFFETDKKMRKECEQRTGKKFDKKEWRAGAVRLLESHHYHTDYCRLSLNGKKQENLDWLLKKQRQMQSGGQVEKTEEPTAAFIMPGITDTVKEKKAERPARGIETMFRVASTNHQRLSDMADSKAHIMISVNSIIISVVIALVVRKLETENNLIIPTFILLVGSVIAVIFSVLATRPKIPNGYFTDEQLASKKVNLLFFGNFYNMDFDHYYAGMKEVMNDGEFLYASLIRDIHSQGIVLGHKYKLLRVSYTIFMFTLIISVLAYAVAIVLFK